MNIHTVAAVVIPIQSINTSMPMSISTRKNTITPTPAHAVSIPSMKEKQYL